MRCISWVIPVDRDATQDRRDEQVVESDSHPGMRVARTSADHRDEHGDEQRPPGPAAGTSGATRRRRRCCPCPARPGRDTITAPSPTSRSSRATARRVGRPRPAVAASTPDEPEAQHVRRTEHQRRGHADRVRRPCPWRSTPALEGACDASEDRATRRRDRATPSATGAGRSPVDVRAAGRVVPLLRLHGATLSRVRPRSSVDTASHARRVPAEPPGRAADEHDQPRQHVDDGPTADGRPRSAARGPAASRPYSGVNLAAVCEHAARRAGRTGRRRTRAAQRRAEDLHDVLGRQQVAHEQAERGEDAASRPRRAPGP